MVNKTPSPNKVNAQGSFSPPKNTNFTFSTQPKLFESNQLPYIIGDSGPLYDEEIRQNRLKSEIIKERYDRPVHGSNQITHSQAIC